MALTTGFCPRDETSGRQGSQAWDMSVFSENKELAKPRTSQDSQEQAFIQFFLGSKSPHGFLTPGAAGDSIS